MGTRGAYGFHKNGVLKVTYNHFDSYPAGLGTAVLEYCRERSVAQLHADFEAIRLIDSKVPPTQADVERAKTGGTVDLSVSERNHTDWYCLLRRAQGNLAKHAEVGLMSDDAPFLKDSLMCEWAYLINLDDGSLDIYQGFQTEPPTSGLFKGHGPPKGMDPERIAAKYCPVNRIARFKLDDLPAELPDYDEEEADE